MMHMDRKNNEAGDGDFMFVTGMVDVCPHLLPMISVNGESGWCDRDKRFCPMETNSGHCDLLTLRKKLAFFEQAVVSVFGQGVAAHFLVLWMWQNELPRICE